MTMHHAWAGGIFLAVGVLSGSPILRAQEPDPPVEQSWDQASAHLWGALVRGTNEPPDDDAKNLDPELVERLGKAFPFAYFRLIGEHTQPVLAEYESWVIPSQELYMKIDSKGPVDQGLGLHLQLWRRENVIVKTDVILKEGSPVFIGGPKWGDDHLLFVILLKDGDSGELPGSGS